MTYRLLLHKNASKVLEKFTQQQKEIFKQKLNLLQANPRKHPQLDIKMLEGYNDLYRLRIGQHRVIYQIKNNELLIFVIHIGNRGDVYKHI